MLLLVGLLLVLGRVTGQHVPRCDQMYSYVERGGQMMGLIQIPDPGGDLALSVTIGVKLRSFLDWEIHDDLGLERDPTGTSQLLNYYVTFPVKNPLPQILLMKFNGRILCRSEVPTSALNFFSSYNHRLKGRTSTDTVLLGVSTRLASTEHPLAPTHGSRLPPPYYVTRRRTTTLPTPVRKPPARVPAPSSVDTSNADMDSEQTPDFSALMSHRPRPTAPTTTTTTTTTTRPSAMYKPVATRPPARVGKDEENCGISVRPQPLMLGGREVEKGDWPWVAAVYEDSTRKLKCGGALINKRFVVVAAHCVAEPLAKEEALIVIMGQFDFSKWVERDTQPREVRRVIIHPNFEASSLRNDIALLYLDDVVEYTMYVRPICLGDDDTSIASLANETGTVIGWNPDEDLPRRALVPIASSKKCAELIGQLTEHTFCAGNLTVSASQHCIGDSEGGLFLPKTGEEGSLRWYLRGIASTRLQNDQDTCAQGGYVVYTDVTQFKPWIRQVIKTTRPYHE